MKPTDRKTFDVLQQRTYSALSDSVPSDVRMKLHAIRAVWLESQWKIFTCVGGTWSAYFSWSAQIDNAFAQFYMDDVFACKTASEFRALVRRSFVEVWDIELTDEEQAAMDLVGQYLPQLGLNYARHVQKLLLGK